MKWLTGLLVLTILSSNAQTTPGCKAVDAYLDKVEKNYWGTARWQAQLDSAISICPTSARAWGDKAVMYLMRGDLSTWDSLLQRAVDINPLYYLGNRGYYKLRYLRDYSGALADLTRQDSLAGFHTLYVSDVHSYIWIAQCNEGLNQPEEALKYYNLAIEKQIKERGEGWVGTYDYLLRGILRLKLKQNEDAIADFDKQIKLYDQLADAFYYRGLAYRALLEYDKAQNDFLHAKTLLEGNGTRRWEYRSLLPDEVFLSDIEKAINSPR